MVGQVAYWVLNIPYVHCFGGEYERRPEYAVAQKNMGKVVSAGFCGILGAGPPPPVSLSNEPQTNQFILTELHLVETRTPPNQQQATTTSINLLP